MPRKNPGSSSGNVISGTSGTDELYAINGSFVLSGGRGDDIYWVDDTGDSVEEKNRGGTDTVQASVDWTLSDNVENLTLVEGSLARNGTGNSEDNIIIGNSDKNTLKGMGGDDTIIGGDGDDTLIGGDGSDTISGGNGTDTAEFSGLLTDYLITGTPDALSVTSVSTGETDLLDGVEYLSFDDGTYAVADLLAPAAPVAADDAVTTDEDTPLLILVLNNDSPGLTLESVSGGNMGTVVINPDGTLSYTPDADANGQDTFTYTAVDKNGAQTTATVMVDITPVNDAPVATDDTLAVSADTSYSGNANLLDNDTDIDGDALSVAGAAAAAASMQLFAASDQSLTITTTSGGTVEVFRDGTYTYTPAAGFSGTDSFAYLAADETGATATASVTIDVQDSGGSPLPDPGPTPYYIDAMLYGDPYRLNAASDVGTAVVVTYSFLDALPSYYDATSSTWSTFAAFNAAQQDAARAMLDAIEGMTNITFVEVTDAPSTITFGLADLGGFKGLAVRPEGLATGTMASDVWIDTQHAGTNFIAGSFAYMTLLHEIGHALGLDHPSLPAGEDSLQYSIMDSSPDMYFSALPQFYQLYDIAALQYLYGANTSYASADDTYTFDTFDNQIKVLWDGGGHDKIDLSDATYGVQVDLTAGAFGTIAPQGSGNFVIALGAVIEDVTGGAFDDVLAGSDWANRINGGGGDDVLSGGAGPDIFEFAAAWGNDTILDFTPGTDVIDLSRSGATFGDLEITYADGNATVQFQDDSIVLVGVDALDSGMFVFV